MLFKNRRWDGGFVDLGARREVSGEKNAWCGTWREVRLFEKSNRSVRLGLSAPDFYKESVTFAWKHQRIGGFCLISSKNLSPKHRFFALFRRAFRDVTFESEVSFTSTLMEPDFLAKSERFAGKARHVWAICRFFSPCLGKFTQTWCSFQAQNLGSKRLSFTRLILSKNL